MIEVVDSTVPVEFRCTILETMRNYWLTILLIVIAVGDIAVRTVPSKESGTSINLLPNTLAATVSDL